MPREQKKTKKFPVNRPGTGKIPAATVDVITARRHPGESRTGATSEIRLAAFAGGFSET
jgi:hypothetical protein